MPRKLEPMGDEGLIVELAAIAHRMWCARMTHEGWTRGPAYDERARTHDALVPFEQLNLHDRRRASRAVRHSEIPQRLERLADYPRGPDREFTIEEMEQGVPVEMVPSPGQDRPSPDERGHIDSWLTDDLGELTVVKVRWPDGQVTAHPVSARELRRV